MNYKKIAEDNYKRFSFIEGNAHIATEYALKTILKLIDDFKVTSVLEVGLGIGSISDTVFKYGDDKKKPIHYTGTEANEFCLEALKKNVISYERINLYGQLSDIPDGNKYDLIIVDGSDASLKSIAAFAKENSIIYVEGWRGSQVAQIKDIFQNCAHVEIISSYKNPQYGPFDYNIWAGGGQLIFINPTLNKKTYWFKERVASFLKRRLRKLK
jgi:SAM-dependent methyltransferase